MEPTTPIIFIVLPFSPDVFYVVKVYSFGSEEGTSWEKEKVVCHVNGRNGKGCFEKGVFGKDVVYHEEDIEGTHYGLR